MSFSSIKLLTLLLGTVLLGGALCRIRFGNKRVYFDLWCIERSCCLQFG
jgi:hypothetical protein